MKPFLKGHNSTTLFRLNDDDEQWLNNMLFGLIIIIIIIIIYLRFKQNKSLYLNGTVLFWQL